MNKRPKHIAIVRFSAMGDVAMLFPVLRAVLAHNDLEITLLTRPQFAPIFSSITQLNVVSVDLKNTYSGIAGLWALAKRIRSLKPDHFLDLHDVLRTKIIRSFLGVLGVSATKFDKGRAEKKRRVLHFDPGASWLSSIHQRYAEAFRALGVEVDLESVTLEPHSNGRRSDDISNPVQSFLNTLQTKDGAIIGLAPFAAYPGKTYPLDCSKALCTALADRGHQVLLFGAPGPEAEALAQLAQDQKKVHLVAGKWTLIEELELISGLNLMIAMDSSNGHLAANFGLPVITLWGATHPSLGFAPFGQSKDCQLCADRGEYPKLPTSVYGNKLPEGYEDVMRSIPVARIVQKAEEQLN